MRRILMMGTFDSKGKEFGYLYRELLRRGVQVLSMDTGVFPSGTDFPVDISGAQVSEAGGESIDSLRKKADRGHAMEVMCQGARALAVKLQGEGEIQGVISMGGGGGTSIAATAMQALPLGFPKVCLTTLAAGDTREYVGTKDIVLYPSIVDICGINRFSRTLISRAAGAVCGMAAREPQKEAEEKPAVFLSMFGNSTQCVEQCVKLLEDRYAPMVFHATGGGGRAMEELIREGYCRACLDITATEWADELCGGILSAGPDRLFGPGKAGIPHVIVPGCLDMVNFGSFPTVPERYRTDPSRRFYQWNPMVTLMRTNRQENEKLGEILARAASQSKAPAAFVLPLKGLSILGGEGQPFCDREADEALFAAIETHRAPHIPVCRVDANINDPAFSQKAVEVFLETVGRAEGK